MRLPFSRQLIPSLVCTAALCALSTPVLAATSGPQSDLLFEQTSQWQLPYAPADIVQSVDGALIFVLTDNNRILIYEPNGQLKGSVEVEPGVKAIESDARGENLLLIDAKKNTVSSFSIDFVTEIDIAGSPFRGNSDAPVTIVVFSDFEWPYCGKVAPLLEQVLEKNSETVKLVFKNMPLRFHQFADPTARAAMAAHNQGKFWEFHDQLFAAEKLSNELINNIAVKLGLDMARFNQDMGSEEIRQKINKDLSDAQKAGVTGTPTIFINGKKLKDRSPQGFQAVIDGELKNK